jgi:sugar-specific transcriptional regulator TrmB
MAQWNTLLKTLGFTDSEAKIYLLSLEVGPSSVQDLAKKAKVSRVTTYAAIEVLSTRGLMSNVQKGKKTLFTSESPERLVSFVQARMTQMQTTLKEVEGLIGDLRLLQRGEKPVVKMFEGKEGLNAINDDILKTQPDTIYEMGNYDAMRNLFSPEDFVPYQKELKRKKIKTEVIAISDKPFVKDDLVKAFRYEDAQHPFFGHVALYDNKIALSSFRGKNISVLIESEIIAQTLKTLFSLAKKSL